MTANSSGTKTAELRYKAWGETRYTSGTTLTTFKYTDQREESSFGLYYYGARWYDPSLARFTSPDTITAGGTQGLDRYHYASNNPLRYIDPTGHDDPAWDEVWEKYSKNGLEALNEEELKMYYNYQGGVTVIGPGNMKDEAAVIAVFTVWAPPVSTFFSSLALADSVAEDVNNGQVSEDTVGSLAGEVASDVANAFLPDKYPVKVGVTALEQITENLVSNSNVPSPPTRYFQYLPLAISPFPYTQFLPMGNYP